MSTPPPAYNTQPNPYAQPQQPQQIQQAGPQYGAPPQQPGQYPVTPPQMPQPEKRKSSFARRFGIRIGVLVILVGGWFAYDQISGGADTAKAGDCVQNKGTDSNPDVHVIDCGNAKAQYKVLKTSSSGRDSDCDNVAGTEVSYTETGRDSLVLCLGKNTP